MTQEAVARLITPTVPTEPALLAKLTDTQKWKLFLYQHALSEGLSVNEWYRIGKSGPGGIIYCESRWRHYDRNGGVLVGRVDSRDTGLGQINTYYQRKRIVETGLDPRDPYDNLELVVHIYKLDGFTPWVCSGL